MAATLFETTWGSIRLFCTEIQTDGSRTKVVHDLTSGDVHPVQDRGRRARRVKVKLAFDDFPGFPSPIDAAAALERAVDTGASAMFSHPLLGTFMAGIGEYMQSMDESGIITADAEFIPEDSVPALSPAGAGTAGVAGEQTVSTAADELDASTKVMTDEEIRDILEDDSGLKVSDDAKQTVASWQPIDSTGVPTRDILNDTARLSNRITSMIELGHFENDIALWPAFRASIMLGDAIRNAATAATSEVSSTFMMRIIETTALLPLAARIYGGAEAQDRARQIASMNDISTPAWLPPGDYIMPARTAAQRSPF